MADSLGSAEPWSPPWERAPKAAPAAPKAAPKAPTVRASAKVPKVSDDFFGPGPAKTPTSGGDRSPSTPRAPAVATHHKIISGTASVQKLSTATGTAAVGKPSTVKSIGGGAAAGAVAGAELGSIVPGLGTAVGAGAGAVLGGVAGGAKGHAAKKAAKSAARQAKRAQLGPAHSVLIAEFLLCMVILALSPLTDKNSTEGPQAFLKRGAATLLFFFVLSLIASGGRGPAKVAAAGGGVVTLTLLLSQRDELVKIADLLTGTGGKSDASAGTGPDGSTLSDDATSSTGLGPDGRPLGTGDRGDPLADPDVQRILNTPDTTRADQAAAAAAQRKLDQIGAELNGGMLGPPGG
jgi:hypothetical protein